MDQLVQALGRPPFEWEKLLELFDKQRAILDNAKSASEKLDQATTIKVIELLEAMAPALLEVASDTIGGFMKFDSRSPPGPDVYELTQLPNVIMQLKEYLYREEVQAGRHSDQMLSGEPHSELPHTCWYCSWIMRRIGTGIKLEGKQPIHPHT